MSTIDSYFVNYVHDNARGTIKSVKIGYKDMSLFSAGMDGNFFRSVLLMLILCIFKSRNNIKYSIM